MNASSFYRWCLVFYINYTSYGNKPTNKPPKQELIDTDKYIQQKMNWNIPKLDEVHTNFYPWRVVCKFIPPAPVDSEE